jgi:hypothetical protein
MSPYGAAPARPPRTEAIAPTIYDGRISVYHVTKESCPAELINVLCEEFEKELGVGRTYPQEGPIGAESFKDYFFHGDVFVGIIIPECEDASMLHADVEAARAGREWNDCVAGSYYVLTISFLRSVNCTHPETGSLIHRLRIITLGAHRMYDCLCTLH